jgi:plasmid stabilization system protein ParE
VAKIVYVPAAQRSLERIFGFYASESLGLAARVLGVIAEAVSALRHSPYLGRRVGEDQHELVVSHGKTGFVVLYRYVPTLERPDTESVEPPGTVRVLAVRHQREAGYGGAPRIE